jgi:hypothetical protein
MMIIYLNDEKLGTEIATKMVAKGWENTYLLSGGIEKFLEEFHELVEGTDVPVPQKKIAEEKEKQKMRKTGMSSVSGISRIKRHDTNKK